MATSGRTWRSIKSGISAKKEQSFKNKECRGRWGARPGLHHELGAHALLIELDSLANHVLVAALVPEVLATQIGYELCQPIAGH